MLFHPIFLSLVPIFEFHPYLLTLWISKIGDEVGTRVGIECGTREDFTDNFIM
jgi:hypothetical protein